MLKIRSKKLLPVAGLVWLGAGINILRIGIISIISSWDKDNGIKDIEIILFAALIFTGFMFMFRRVVSKHVKRILGYGDEKKSVFLFFDFKGYLMMAFMMGLGIVLRRGNFLPDFFFAFFYTGLGSALSISGIRFIISYKGLHIRQIIWIGIGLLSVGLGTAGIFLPILPTVPLYLLGSFSFLNSSENLYNKFRKSKVYIKYLKPYLDAGGISKRGKVILIGIVTLQIGIVSILLRKSIIALIILAALYLGFIISMLFIVKTVTCQKQRRNK